MLLKSKGKTVCRPSLPIIGCKSVGKHKITRDDDVYWEVLPELSDDDCRVQKMLLGVKPGFVDSVANYFALS